MTPTLDAFTRAYLEAALWTCDPYHGISGQWSEHDDWTIGNIDVDSVATAITVCEAFQRDNAGDLAATKADDDRNGIDFWLTRNHHGAGFWDRGYGELGDRLTDAAHTYGEAYCYGPETADNGTSTPEQLAEWDKVIYIDD